MTIPVRQMLVAEKNYKTKCPNAMTAEYITFHNTYNDASANNEIQYMISNSNQVSYHFAVDDKEVVQGVPVNRNAWHCGESIGNRKSIGVEVCYSKSGGTKYYQAEGLAIRFIAQLLHERGWGVDRVKKHQDWSGKYCPHRVLDEGRWQQVLNSIQEELNILKCIPVQQTQQQSQPIQQAPQTGKASPEISLNNKVVAKVKVLVDDLNIRVAPTTNSDISRKALKGEAFDVYENRNDWHNVGGANWVFGNNGQYLSLIKDDPKPAYPGTLIKDGSRGEFVKMVQKIVGVLADGIFGAKTKAAVIAWQRAHSLSADGIVGPATWSVMF